jgi:hypothetical protein
MNAITQDEAASLCLVEIIELKWLLAGHGVHVHVERLQNDPEYARELLAHAAAAPGDALRETALRVRVRLGLGAA